jgi:hypothetical protein
MTESSYQDAVQALKNRIGDRWDGLEADGRDEMVRVLKQELGYDDRKANDAIDAMIKTGALRYHAAGATATEVGAVVPAPVGTGTIGTGVPAAGGTAGLPLAPGASPIGYWQIGPGVVEAPGRKGQVMPS